jgi:signal transduction histidine kinase
LRPSDRWRFWPGWLDLAWVVFTAANLVAILVFARWETVPFHFIWISFTLLYGFRVWPTRPTLVVLAIVMVTTALAIGLDVYRGTEPVDELNEAPLMAAMFWAMVWHARRRMAAEQELIALSEENARLLLSERRFLQDASHQLRTPITIALGHSELLARELASNQERRDINVVVGELNRLKSLSERLLLIAASADPDFLRRRPVALEVFISEVYRRWRPTAPRRWQLGTLDAALVSADAERLELAVDALIENAVQHTAPGDAIRLSVIGGPGSPHTRIVVEDSGSGIPPDQLASLFDRFSTSPHTSGTGLGLALVRSVARGHQGDVAVASTPGQGSRFEILLAATPAEDGTSPDPATGGAQAPDTLPLDPATPRPAQ